MYSDNSFHDLHKMKYTELIAFCKKHKINRYSGKKKYELITYIKRILAKQRAAKKRSVIASDDDYNDVQYNCTTYILLSDDDDLLSD